MPTQKDFKRRVRDRMNKTGESYTAARRQLLAKRQPAAPAVDLAQIAGMSNAKVHEKTGRTWRQWTTLLDAIGAARMPHRTIAQQVSSLGIPDWWTQTVTVGYERIRGLRQRGQRRDGAFEVSKSRTFNVPVGVLFDAFADVDRRRGWLPGDVSVRSARRPKRMRIAWTDGTIVQLEFMAKSTSKSSVAVQHQQLRDRAAADAVRSEWSARLDRLREMLQHRKG
jgi:hypothetical protein